MTTTRALTVKQATALWVVEQNEPASVADVAGHMMVSEAAARSALNRLERDGLVGRTYTGHHRGSRFAFELTRKGAACLARADTVLDSEVVGCAHENVRTYRRVPPRSECEDCGADVTLIWSAMRRVLRSEVTA